LQAQLDAARASSAECEADLKIKIGDLEKNLATQIEENENSKDKIHELEASLTELCEDMERQHEEQKATESKLEAQIEALLAKAALAAQEAEEARSVQEAQDAATRSSDRMQRQDAKDLADVKREAAAHKKAREQAEERSKAFEAEAMKLRKKAEEMAEKLEAVSKVAASQSATNGQALQPQSKPTIDWTTYGIDEDLDGEHVEDHVRIHHLTLTAEQLRSHCQTLEVENASMKDLMAAFEMGLDAHAQAIGHVNHKQKIRYTLQLKETINRLLDELRRSRTRIFQLEGAKGVGIGESIFEEGRPWMTSTTTTMTRQTVHVSSRRKST
jgi:myosin heavy subunit